MEVYKFIVEGYFSHIGIIVKDKNIKVQSDSYENAQKVAIDIMCFRYDLNREDCHIITGEIIS